MNFDQHQEQFFLSEFLRRLKKTVPKTIIRIVRSRQRVELRIFYWGNRPHKWILETLASMPGRTPEVHIDWHREGVVKGCVYRIAPTNVAEAIIDGRKQRFNIIKTIKRIIK